MSEHFNIVKVSINGRFKKFNVSEFIFLLS